MDVWIIVYTTGYRHKSGFHCPTSTKSQRCLRKSDRCVVALLECKNCSNWESLKDQFVSSAVDSGLHEHRCPGGCLKSIEVN